MKICLHIKINVCFTDGIALLGSDVSREFGPEDYKS